MRRNLGFWMIQVPGWLLFLYLVYAQAIPAIYRYVLPIIALWGVWGLWNLSQGKRDKAQLPLTGH